MIWQRILFFLTAALLAAGAHAQIAFRASSNATIAAENSITHVGAGASATRETCGNITPAIPAGVNGDLLIALVNVREYSATLTMTGWTQLYSDSYPALAAAEEMQVYIFYRFAAGGDPNTITQAGTCSSMAGQIARFRGVDATQPFEVNPIVAANVNRQNSGDLDTGTVTTTLPGSMLLVAGFVNLNRTVTEGAGWSTSFDSSLNLTRDIGMSLAYQLQANAGAATVTNWDRSGATTDENYGIIFALRPLPSLTLNVPAGTVANDVMTAHVTFRPCSNTSGGACTTTMTAPAGWTQVEQRDQTTGAGTGGYGHRMFVYQRVATGAEPASYGWYFGGTPNHAGAAGAILSFSGVDTTSPVVAEAGQNTAAAATHVAPSVDTTPETNAWLVTTHTVNSSGTWTPPGGMTERVDVSSNAAPNDLGLALEVNTQLIAAAGATGTRSATQANPPAVDTGATHSLALRPAPAIAHYSISVASTTVANCDYAEVTIVGHNAAHAATNVPSTRTVTLTTSTGTGVWQAGLVTGTGAWLPSGLNNGTATYAWPGGESGFTVRLRQSAVTPVLSVNLTDGSVTEGTGAEDPSIAFVNSAFRISNGANALFNIGTQISGKPSDTGFGAQNLYLQAIRTDTTTGACTTIFPSGTDVSISVGAQCVSPAACAQNLTLTSTSPASNSATFVPGAAGTYPGTMNFRFGANAEAPFSLNYLDAGQINLQFRAALPAPPAATYITGTSNNFVVRPFGFAFRGANEATAITHGVDHTSPVFTSAGDNFTMTLGAYRWSQATDSTDDGVPDAGEDIRSNGLTPNFAADTTVSATSNTAGVAGTIDRASGGSVIAAAEWTGGVATINNWRYSEVGNVLLSATSDNYLGDAAADITGDSGLDGTGTPNVGRFRPKHFAVTAASVTNRYLAACGGTYTYMNEGLQLNITLQAQNTQNNKTDNYTGLYARFVPTTVGNWVLGARSGATALTGRLDLAIDPTATWSNGQVATVISTGIRRANPDAPDGPYTVSFGIAPDDGDTPAVTMNTLDLDADISGTAERKNIGVTTDVRYGRLRMESPVGSEKLDLPIQLEAQYWNGASFGFVRNTSDSCTSFSQQHFTLGSYTGNLNACETMVTNATVTLASGIASINLSAPCTGAPCAGNDGSVLVTLNLGAASGNYCSAIGAGPGPAATTATRPYLLGRWNDASNPDGNGNTSYDDNPSSRASFGLYSSQQPNNFIYFRENY